MMGTTTGFEFWAEWNLWALPLQVGFRTEPVKEISLKILCFCISYAWRGEGE